MKKILLLSGLLAMLGFVNAETKMCIEVYAPVCGVKNGVIQTYSNDCFAKGDWATILHKGVCTGNEKYNLVKNLKYITWQTKVIVDKAIDKFFERLSSKTLPEQLNILQEKIKKIQQVREKLQKAWKLSELISEVLFYLEFRFEEKVNELKSKLTGGKNDISPELLQSILEETR